MVSITDRFRAEILRLPKVQEAEGDMFGERSFRVGGREFLHIHGRSTLHILLPKEVKAEALAKGQAYQHPYAPRSGMVEVPLRSEEQLPNALVLAKTSYEFLARNAARMESRAAA